MKLMGDKISNLSPQTKLQIENNAQIFLIFHINRSEAIQRMNRSLDEFVIEGITTTIPLHKKLLNHKKFINSDFNVSWLDKEKII